MFFPAVPPRSSKRHLWVSVHLHLPSNTPSGRIRLRESDRLKADESGLKSLTIIPYQKRMTHSNKDMLELDRGTKFGFKEKMVKLFLLHVKR